MGKKTCVLTVAQEAEIRSAVTTARNILMCGPNAETHHRETAIRNLGKAQDIFKNKDKQRGAKHAEH
mgnify:CR=1 FL=1